MNNNFYFSLDSVLVHEGGYVNHPKDPGGATNKGITQNTFNAFRARMGKPYADVRHITDDEVAYIYKIQYWNVVKGDELPDGVDYAVFDFAVNSGPARAVKFVQRIVGTEADGVLGQITMAAIENYNPESLVTQLCDNRLAWLKRLRHWPTFGRGWERRVREVKRAALTLVAQDHKVVESSGPAGGKGEGKESLTASLKEMSKDPKAIGAAVATTLPAASTTLNGDGPVQWGIGIGLGALALALAYMLWASTREY